MGQKKPPTATRHAWYCRLLSRKRTEATRYLIDVTIQEPKIVSRYSDGPVWGQQLKQRAVLTNPIPDKSLNSRLGLRDLEQSPPCEFLKLAPRAPFQDRRAARSGITIEQDRKVKQRKEMVQLKMRGGHPAMFLNTVLQQRESSVQSEKQL